MPFSPVAELRSKLSVGLFWWRFKQLVSSYILSSPLTASLLVVSNGCLQGRRNCFLRLALGKRVGVGVVVWGWVGVVP